jgi:hypothetical protein
MLSRDCKDLDRYMVAESIYMARLLEFCHEVPLDFYLVMLSLNSSDTAICNDFILVFTEQ